MIQKWFVEGVAQHVLLHRLDLEAIRLQEGEGVRITFIRKH